MVGHEPSHGTLGRFGFAFDRAGVLRDSGRDAAWESDICMPAAMLESSGERTVHFRLPEAV